MLFWDSLQQNLLVLTGTNKDYILNRFNGQARLSVPLVADESITSGTRLSRGFLISQFAQPYLLTNGDTLDIVIDRGTPQTITFVTADFSDITQASATEVVTKINSLLTGGIASVTTDNRIQVQTNTFDDVIGAIKIESITGTAGNLGFPEDTERASIPAHFASILSDNSEPFNFIEGDRLVIVLDNDSTNKTFDIIMDLDGDVAVAGPTLDTQFTANVTGLGQNFTNKFTNDDDVKDFKLSFKTATNGANVGVERTITAYNSTTGVFTLSSALPADITAADTFIIIPVTLANVVVYLNNTSTSTFSLQGKAETADENTKIQISTLTDGGSGFVNVTGGNANSLTSLFTANGSGNNLFVENALWGVGMDVIVTDDDPDAAEVTSVTTVADTSTFEKSTITFPAVGGTKEEAIITFSGTKETVTITFPSGGAAAQADFFTFGNQAGTDFAVNLDIDANGTVPTAVQYTGASIKIEADIASGDTNIQVAAKVVAAIGVSFTDVTITDNFDGTVDFDQDIIGTTTDPIPLNANASGAGSISVNVTQQGTDIANQADYFIYRNKAGDDFAIFLDIDGAGTTPTGAAYLAATTTIEVDINSTDANIAVAAKVVAAIGGSISDITITDNFDGTVDFDNDLVGIAIDPVPHNSNDTGAGSISTSVGQQGVNSPIQADYFTFENEAGDTFAVNKVVQIG